MGSLHTSGSAKHNFPKKERLTGKKEIQELFDKGSSFYLPPFLIKHTSVSSDCDFPRILVSVPKKKFKRAVDRNKLKRQIKEAYRLNKQLLLEGKFPCQLGIIYVANEKLPYDVLEKKLILVLRRFQDDQ